MFFSEQDSKFQKPVKQYSELNILFSIPYYIPKKNTFYTSHVITGLEVKVKLNLQEFLWNKYDNYLTLVPENIDHIDHESVKYTHVLHY